MWDSPKVLCPKPGMSHTPPLRDSASSLRFAPPQARGTRLGSDTPKQPSPRVILSALGAKPGLNPHGFVSGPGKPPLCQPKTRHTSSRLPPFMYRTSTLCIADVGFA
ncbi:hypothetical protein JCGZ_22285 [Jatropha curcas]|uniref:Uncharacterized protein n=1 Tax=Jatropha curcas TaxID=180498 RepID=A0A067K222_JATCU|nr:hypothetical protein JCGZ_22285 [Jatropha curcas]